MVNGQTWPRGMVIFEGVAENEYVIGKREEREKSKAPIYGHSNGEKRERQPKTVFLRGSKRTTNKKKKKSKKK
jgi:hypothetical protein